MGDIIKIVVIDHENHEAFIEQIDSDIIERDYAGEEEKYILDKYGFKPGEKWSWDYVTRVTEYLNGFAPTDIQYEE